MTTVLPSPDFTWDPKANPPKAGLSPKRNGTYKLAPEAMDGHLIVHNCGHAGAQKFFKSGVSRPLGLQWSIDRRPRWRSSARCGQDKSTP